ncbi:MAG: T9SS type A sorting domain-containing protein [Flavobacteriales bacterium]|nr:T9SS type A sorting domain-containing protein [Flavobacteriales bacterium]
MRILLFTFLFAAVAPAVAQPPPTADDLVPELPEAGSTHIEMVLYPNPTSGRLRVLWGTRSLVRMPLEVRSMDGRLLLLDSLSPEHELDVSQLQDGLYRLLLMDLSGVRAQAVFKVVR